MQIPQKPGKNYGKLMAEMGQGLAGTSEYFHAYYSQLNSPQVRERQFSIGRNGNLNMDPIGFNPQYKMNEFGNPFFDKKVVTQGERVKQMYNPYMLNRNYVDSRELRGNLKSEMDHLAKMLDQNLL